MTSAKDVLSADDVSLLKGDVKVVKFFSCIYDRTIRTHGSKFRTLVVAINSNLWFNWPNCIQKAKTSAARARPARLTGALILWVNHVKKHDLCVINDRRYASCTLAFCTVISGVITLQILNLFELRTCLNLKTLLFR